MGSSPLTRGKLRARTCEPPSAGLIPAHAGKTSSVTPKARSTGAHPRSRGENSSSRRCRSSSKGSSPLTRGKRQAVYPAGNARGLIPAHAGKTPGHRCRSSPARAHPRSRGENEPASRSRRDAAGSSPLTRGKQHLRPHRGPRYGLIPAHAGKTNGGVNCHGRCPAHPRSRGENTWQASRPASLKGSSPLTRGKLVSQTVGGTVCGLIPAHAGKTRRGSDGSVHRGAHPRSRGENQVVHEVHPRV